jgi:uncharacterized damage-inducible protein DinB
MDAHPLAQTWLIHDRINRYLLDRIDEGLLDSSITAKFRSIRHIFTHIHNVRLMWLKAAAPQLLEALDKLDPKAATKSELGKALESSGTAIAQLLEQSALTGKVKGFKPHATAFLGYLISHESHHRGQIGWTLKAVGKPLDQKTAYGIWEWGVR